MTTPEVIGADSLVVVKTGEMSSVDVDDFIQQNRALAEEVEKFRGYWESEEHWKARREFLLRNINDFELEQLDQLVALSMVWANNVFMGCRYSSELLEKVKEMAEGIVVVDAPIFKTRDEIMKNQVDDRMRPFGWDSEHSRVISDHKCI